MSHKFIDIEDLTYSYNGGDSILNGVNLCANAGDTIALVGSSGSGKSTFLKIISGILDQSRNISGRIKINGASPSDYIKKRRLSYMFQDTMLLPNLNVKDNIALPLWIARKDIVDNNISKILEVIGLSAYSSYYPWQLSGGMRTRVALAQSLVTNPELLLLDEPFSALDIGWKKNLYKYLSNYIGTKKTTVILVTHDIQEAIFFAKSIFVLSSAGKIINKYNLEQNEKDKLLGEIEMVPVVFSKLLSAVQHEITIDSNNQ